MEWRNFPVGSDVPDEIDTNFKPNTFYQINFEIVSDTIS